MSKVNAKATHTVTYVLKDKYGRRKKMWNENALGVWLREHKCEVRIPFVTGFWKYTITRSVKWRRS
jgi:hypothetical protein